MNILPKHTKPVVLIVLDGFGIAPDGGGNAITQTPTPNLNSLWKNYPHCQLRASGKDVGLPLGVQGNSEVGHMGLGAGKVVFQEIAKIDHDIERGTFYENEVFRMAVDHAKKTNGKIHLMGLTSPGKVHSSLDHLYASLTFCAKAGLKEHQVFIHAFTDGRDTSPQSAIKYLKSIEKQCAVIGVGQIASIVGRYYAMDRDNNWDRTQLAYNMIAYGKGTPINRWQDAIEKSYKDKITDEFITPHVITKRGKPIATITPGDSIVFFNYRADRAVQLSKAFYYEEPIKTWPRKPIEDIFFAGFSNYEKGLLMNRAKEDVSLAGGESAMVKKLFKAEMKKTTSFPKFQIFPPERIEKSLGRVISDAGLKQLRISESEKFPHVTYFFNCREKTAFPGEDRVEIPSPKDVATYDLKPEMSSYEITDQVIKHIDSDKYDFILINYANTDMVAHTGDLEASKKAVAVVDECLGKVVAATIQKGGDVLITADHGNVEELLNLRTGKVDTEHSTNPVPFIYISQKMKEKDLMEGILADIAPTILAALKVPKPTSMIGRNLLG